MTERQRPPAAERPLSPYEVLVFLARSWRTLALPALLVALALVGVALLRGQRYTATAAFYPQRGESEMSGMRTLTEQLGIGLPLGGQTGPSLQFYSDLLDSRELLSRTALTVYTPGDAGAGGEGTFIELMGIRAASEPEALDAGVETLREALTVVPDGSTGVIDFSVTTPHPELSQLVAGRLLELLVEFNQSTRQSQAKSEREFAEERLEEATGELYAAEDSLKAFLVQNIRFENSPELAFEHDRLQRRVMTKQEVVLLLTEAYENARIEEVRNAPVITVVDPPRTSSAPDRRGLVSRLVVGLLAGSLLGAALALWLEFMRRSRAADPEAYEEFRRLWARWGRKREGRSRVERVATTETVGQET